MRDSKIVILDGVPGGGKTTLTEHFKNEGIYIVPELVDHSLANKEDNFDYYIISDFIKMSIASLERFRGKNVVMDRGPISTLAFTFAHDEIYGTKRYEELLKIFKYEFSRNIDNKYISNFLYYIDLETSLKRKNRSLTDNRADSWFYKPFLEVFFDYYKDIDTHSGKFEGILGEIIVIDGNTNLEQSIEKIHKNFISK